MTDLVIAALLISGGAFAAIAGLGLLRLPDVLIRMHASTKAGTLGVGLMVIGVAVHFGGLVIATKAVLIILFLLLTAPVAAHLIGRAAYRTGTPLWSGTVIDEWHGQAAPDRFGDDGAESSMAPSADGPRPRT